MRLYILPEEKLVGKTEFVSNMLRMLRMKVESRAHNPALLSAKAGSFSLASKR